MDSAFSIYDASAGSGKTFTVVREYLGLLLKSPRPDAFRHILAITFTNKAAKEMKSRIIDSLRDFANPEKRTEMQKQLENTTGQSSDQIKQKAERILKKILHNYAAFEISTIDGFTHRILRTFAKDLQLPVNFEVEMETKLLFSETVDRLLAKTGEDRRLTEALIDFALAKTDADKSWDISRDLNAISSLLTDENNLLALENLKGADLNDFKDFRHKLHKAVKRDTAELEQAGRDFLDFMQRQNLEFKHFTASYVPKHFEKMKDGQHKTPKDAKWRDNIEEVQLYNKKTPAAAKETIDHEQSEIARRYRHTEGLLFSIAFRKEILRDLTSLSLLQSIYTELQEVKSEQEILPIFEFNRKIAESIQGQPAPFIYERLGERYQHFFIDEFQDTSLLQWSNLQPLINNTLAAASGDNSESLTIVGDAKQAIYRWRGGKAEQLMQLSEADRHTHPFTVEKTSHQLNSNFRSLPEIVHFNNDFFSHCAEFLSDASYQDLYKNAQQTPQQSTGGYVELDFLETKNADEEHEEFPAKTLDIIADLKADGQPLHHIAVLVRKHDQGVSVAQKLSENGISIISSESLLLKNAPEVRFIMKLLEFSQNPSEDHLKYELLDLAWEHNWVETSETRFSFIESMLQYNGSDFFKHWEAYGYSVDLEKFQQLPFYNGVEYLFREFGFMTTPNAYIQYFLDLIYEYIQGKTPGLSGFLDYWEERSDKLSITAPEAVDAVQIMTIHQSKGLEFPIVIHPFANTKIDDTRLDYIWVDLEENEKIPTTRLKANKQMLKYNNNTASAYRDLIEKKELDNLNLFYVTFTRASEQLYVLSTRDTKKDGRPKTNTLSGLLISFLQDNGRWETENFSFGEKPAPSATKTEENESIDIPLYSRQINNSSVDVITRSGELWESETQQAIDEGNLIHDLMRRIKYTDDLSPVLRQAENTGLMTREETAFYKDYLSRIVHQPDLKPFFSRDYTVYNEREILQNGDFYRLDRLCIHNKTGKATVIDYKTGKATPADKTQIENYANLLRQIGLDIDKKILVYIDREVEPKFV